MAIKRVITRKFLVPLLNKKLAYLQENPEENLVQVANELYQLVNRLSFIPLFKNQLEAIKNLAERDSAGRQLIINILRDTDPNIAKKILENFIVNAVWLGIPKQKEETKRTGTDVPFFLLIDPTELCNYECKGCWAGAYGKAEMEIELFNRIMGEARKLGIYYIVVSGGEPTLWPHLIEVFKENNDMAFMMYTNGSRFNKAFSEQIAEVGNVIPCFSIEGFEEKTDERRGKGAWDKVMQAMDNMKKLGVPFGYSITQTHFNVREVMSDKFVDFMIDKGAKIAWYFQYIPIGNTPDLLMMLTPEQRMSSYHIIHYLRSKKSLFVADFWNDGPYTGGCIAGGRRYFHITANGGIEPCAFIHLSQGNMKDMSLREALQLPFFKEMQKLQPFSSNLLSPCLLVDNPDYFRKISCLPGVKSTDDTVKNMGEAVGNYLDKLSKEWEKLSRLVFEKDFPKVASKTQRYKKRKKDLLEKYKDDLRKVIRFGKLE